MKHAHPLPLPFPFSTLLTLCIALLTLLTTQPVYSGGMVVHMFQSEKAVAQLKEEDLKQLLTDNANALNSGTQYPDAGYSPSFYGQEKHVWGEASHWAPFIEVYLQVVIEQCQGRYLSDPDCSQLVAHFLGAAAHGLQDQVFDGLFIPKVTEIDHKGQETTDIGIDMVLLREHDRKHSIPKPWFTPADTLTVVYQRMNYSDDQANRAQILAATKVSEAGRYGEDLIAPFLYWQYKNLMPWGSRNYMTYPGGVEFGGRTTANFWSHLWKKLNGLPEEEPANITTIPASGAEHIAVNRPNTDNKISITFDRYIIPASVNSTSFEVRDAEGNQILGSFGLFANSSQQTAEASMILFRPYNTLDFDTTYTVSLNTGILDEDHNSIFGLDGYQWSFTTEPDVAYQQLGSQGFCLGLRKYDPNNTSIEVELQDCQDTRHQQWVEDDMGRWHNRFRADLCLQAKGDRARSWVRIVANTCSNHQLQQWQFNSGLNQLKLLHHNYAVGTFLNAWAGIDVMLFRPRDITRQHWTTSSTGTSTATSTTTSTTTPTTP